MSHKKDDNRKNVVIVGGGGGGHLIARLLSLKLNPVTHNLILIDPRPYRILLPASLRLVTSAADKLEETILLPYDKVFDKGNGTFIQGKVTSIRQGEGKGGSVVLANGETIEYEYLVLSPGNLWEGPSNFPEDADDFTAFLKNMRDQIKEANDIVLIGGGAVGIEFAGEIKEFYPNKNVTIVHGGNHLLNDAYPDKFRLAIETRLPKRGINVVLNDFIDEIPSGTFTSVTTRSGKTIKADTIFRTSGSRPNTKFIDSLGSDILTSFGQIKVRPTLQLVSHDNIYAAGDVLEWKEQKQIAKANNHAAVIVDNILASINGRSPSKEYKGSIEMIVITLGKTGGVGYLGILWGIVLGDWFARLVKSRTLLVSMTRSSLGY